MDLLRATHWSRNASHSLRTAIIFRNVLSVILFFDMMTVLLCGSFDIRK